MKSRNISSCTNLTSRLVVNQLGVELGDTVNRLVDRVNRAITGGCIRFSDIAAAQIDRGGGGDAGTGLDVKFVQLEMFRLFITPS